MADTAPTPSNEQVSNDATPTPAPTPPAQPADTPPATGTTETQPAGTESAEQSDGLENATTEQLLEEVKKLRRENARERVNAKQKAAEQAQQEFAQKIGKALGLVQDGDDENTPTVDDLTQELENTRAAQRAQAIEFAAWKQSADLGVDPKALLNQRSFYERVKDLDPSSGSFDEDIKTAIETEKTEYPFIVTTPQTPGRSSAPLNQQRTDTGTGDEGLDPAGLAKSVLQRSHYN